MRGTPSYLAPELWEIYNKNEEDQIPFQYNPLSTDVYALGKIILELLIDK